MTERAVEEATTQVLPLLGPAASVLHGARALDAFGGGDLDCVVPDLDRQWPLRLGGEWHLCQCLRYDTTGWYWILERKGEVLAVDTLASDPDGIGCYGFPARLVADGVSSDVVRAAYLTVKRLRKRNRDPQAWTQVAELARTDPPSFGVLLAAILGPRLGRAAGRAILAGKDPGARIGRAARLRRVGRLVTHPPRLLRLGRLKIARLLDRLLRPTGLVVVVAGPDGSGKSTLAAALPAACTGLFRRSARIHFRKGFLPRPGALIARPAADSSRPHGRSAHGPVLSLALLAYQWLDALLEAYLRLQPLRRRTALVVVERGWWDIAVDPLRYRLAVPPRLVRLLGRFLPRPDLVLLLSADPATISERAQELPVDEIERQLAGWKSVVPEHILVQLDAGREPGTVLAAARDVIVERLEQRTISRIGAGWANIGSRDGEPRLVLPRASRRAVAAALSLYRPSSQSTRVTWSAARALAPLGFWRLLPRRSAPPSSVRAALGELVPPGGTIATARANHPGRYNALVLDREGAALAFAKAATDRAGRAALEREAEAIARFGSLLDAPLRAPCTIAAASGVLVLKPLDASAPVRPDRVPSDVVRALAPLAAAGVAHGDFAPWNLLRVRNDWILVDWEEAGPNDLPFFDLAHYLVQSHALLGTPTADDLLGLARRGWTRRLISAYADAAHVPASEWPAALSSYLRRAPTVSSSDRRSNDVLAARRALLGAIQSR